MKYIDKHKGFGDKELRDALSSEYQKVGDKAIGTEERVQEIISKIDELQRELIRENRAMALNQILKSKGWKCFDLTRFVKNSGDEGCPDFVGTANELDKLLKKSRKENSLEN